MGRLPKAAGTMVPVHLLESVHVCAPFSRQVGRIAFHGLKALVAIPSLDKGMVFHQYLGRCLVKRRSWTGFSEPFRTQPGGKCWLALDEVRRP